MSSRKPSLVARIVILLMQMIKKFMSSPRIPLKWQRKFMDLPGKLPFLLRGTDLERIEFERPGPEAGPPIKAAWITPRGVADEKVLLYLHGGHFMLGSIDSHSPMVADLARSCGCKALAVDYRLGPEHQFPAALEDCLAAYKWLVVTGYRPENILIAGDSAGGNLTASVLVGIRDSGGPMPAGGAMLCPATDLAMTGDSIVTNAAIDPAIDPEWGRQRLKLFLGDTDPRDPRCSPFYADLSGLPPLLIQCGSREVLLDDATGFAERARAAGVDVDFEVFEGMFHVFQMGGPYMPESKDALLKIGSFCRERMG